MTDRFLCFIAFADNLTRYFPARPFSSNPESVVTRN